MNMLPDEGGPRWSSDPVAALNHCLDLVAKNEGEIHAFVAFDISDALAAAKESQRRREEGCPLSAIDGMVIGIKDVFETANMPTGQGSPIWEGHRTGRDAATVQALRGAGAIILGKCTTTEFASTEPLHNTRNPRDLARTPGGSSSGSAAAVAAGFVHAALGTQVLGSVLRPASYCGCVGFKPTFGAINRGGSFDQWSQSCVGLLATNIPDTWNVAAAIAERVGGDPGYWGLGPSSVSPAPRKPRRLIALETPGWAACTPAARQSLEAACRQIEGAGVEISCRRNDEKVAQFEAALADLIPNAVDIMNWELRWPLGSYRRTSPDKLSNALLSRLSASEATTPLQRYQDLLDWRSGLRQTFMELCDDFEGVILLSATGAAPPGFAFTGNPAMNITASTLGIPAVTIPVLADGELPLGLQVAGAARNDLAVLSAAMWLEELLCPINTR